MADKLWICERLNYRYNFSQCGVQPEWIVVARVRAETKKEARIKASGHPFGNGPMRIRKAPAIEQKEEL